ncbi:unnamed protein product [Chrysoparadoxa australica]
MKHISGPFSVLTQWFESKTHFLHSKPKRQETVNSPPIPSFLKTMCSSRGIQRSPSTSSFSVLGKRAREAVVQPEAPAMDLSAVDDILGAFFSDSTAAIESFETSLTSSKRLRPMFQSAEAQEVDLLCSSADGWSRLAEMEKESCVNQETSDVAESQEKAPELATYKAIDAEAGQVLLVC